jgi:parvulin-like peptidyl-prolyl isomerase
MAVKSSKSKAKKSLSSRSKTTRQGVARAAIKSTNKTPAKTSTKQVMAKKTDEKIVITQIPSFTKDIKNPRIFIPIILVIIAVLLFVFRGLFIVAIVNGQPITRFGLDRALEKKYAKQEVSSLITQTLIFQEASNKNITVSDGEINSSVKQVSDSLSKQGQTLDSALALRGMTKQDFIDQLKIQKIVEKILGDQVKVSDKEVQDYVDKNKDSLPTGLSDSDLKNQVRQQLEQQKLSDKAQAWIADLQKKANVNYFVNF